MSEFLFSQMWTSRAESGDPVAQFNLGYCYEMGQGTTVNPEAATKWYLRAAMQGHARAQYHLGLAYSFGGRELDWNLAEATRWLTIAARSGIAEASHALQALRATPEDRALGEQLARQFIPTPEPQNPVQHAMSEEMSLGQRFTNPSQMSFGF